MKRFSFSLQPVLKFKETTEKKQKADLAEIQAILRRLHDQRDQLDAAFVRTRESLDRVMEEQKDIPNQMARHDAYFRRIREEKAILAEKIKVAEAEKIRRQEALILTMKEIKTLDNLKEEQYELYLEEVAQEEAKELGDLVSYKATAGEG